MKDLNDKDVTLQQYKGEVVLVNFWATWCEPCKVEIPWMIEFQQKYSPRGFTILGISMDEDGKKAIQPFLDKERFDVGGQKEPMSYPILLGSDAIAEKFGGVLGLPPACSSPGTAKRSGPSSAWSITTTFPRPSRACSRPYPVLRVAPIRLLI